MPDFLSTGNVPRRDSAILEVLQKIVGATQDNAVSPNPANDPLPQDTDLTLDQKWLKSIRGD